MNNSPDHDRLLDDILAEGISPDFQGRMLERTLLQVRHKKRVARLNRGLVAVALLFCVSLTVWKAHSPASPATKLESALLDKVSSQPLAASMIVETKVGSVKVVTSTDSNLAIVESGPDQGQFEEINDQQLLALLAGRPAALVRDGPDRAQLLFLNPADARGFTVP